MCGILEDHALGTDVLPKTGAVHGRSFLNGLPVFSENVPHHQRKQNVILMQRAYTKGQHLTCSALSEPKSDFRWTVDRTRRSSQPVYRIPCH